MVFSIDAEKHLEKFNNILLAGLAIAIKQGKKENPD